MEYQCIFIMVEQNDLKKLLKYNTNELIEKLNELEKTEKTYSTFLDYLLDLRLFFTSLIIDSKIENIEHLAWFTGTHKIGFYKGEDEEINFFEKYESFINIIKLLENNDIYNELKSYNKNFETAIMEEYNDLLKFYKDAFKNKKTIIFYQKLF